MALSADRTTDLRDAAVAAALAGAVIVVIGYATGLGLSTTPATTPPTPGIPSSMSSGSAAGVRP